MTSKTATGNKISNQRKINTRVVATLVYAIVNSRIDYCNAILAGAPRAVMDKLQRVLNAAARVDRHRHLEVWPRPGSDTAWRTSLARRPRPGVFQVGSDSSPVSERPRTAVPVGLLRSGCWCRHSAALAFRQPSAACSTSLPAQHVRPSGLFSCRPHSLELPPGFHPGPDHQCRLLQTFALNVPVRSILVHSAR